MNIKEITSAKYAEQSGISHFTVKKYCRIGALSCRKINSNGDVITDYKNGKKGTWFVNIDKSIGER